MDIFTTMSTSNFISENLKFCRRNVGEMYCPRKGTIVTFTTKTSPGIHSCESEIYILHYFKCILDFINAPISLAATECKAIPLHAMKALGGRGV
jgi:hypothetical protein